VWRIAIAWNNRQAEVRFGQKRKEGASVSASGLISGLSRFMHRPRCAGGSGTLIGCRNADYANRVTGKTNVLDQKYRLLGASLIPEQPFMVQSGRSQRVLDYLRCKCPPQPACRVVANCALWFAIFTPMILACDARCHAVSRGSFAISFANSPHQPMSAYPAKADELDKPPKRQLLTQSRHINGRTAKDLLPLVEVAGKS
jgi:hypothetical protein